MHIVDFARLHVVEARGVFEPGSRMRTGWVASQRFFEGDFRRDILLHRCVRLILASPAISEEPARRKSADGSYAKFRVAIDRALGGDVRSSIPRTREPRHSHQRHACSGNMFPCRSPPSSLAVIPEASSGAAIPVFLAARRRRPE